MEERIIEIHSLEDERVAVFAGMTDRQLRCGDSGKGVLIAESPKVINVALDAGYEPLSLLAERKHLEGDAREIVECIGDVPVYTGSRELLTELTGYKLTRGVLCAMRRKARPQLTELLKDARRVAVIDGVSDTTNIGAIFRSAAALGVDGVLLTREACDPFNRRSIRVSMGSVFLVPWTWLDGGFDALRHAGFKTVAMALRNDSIPLDSPQLLDEERLAIVLGTEGDGLSSAVITGADYVVKIPMFHNVDSLNVAAASAVAFWELCAKKR
ncbi:MAG: RNA methyltransferase [Lachnoclostridium sp.]|nr:RNA methyltransferase [Lachnoclostridium sp.]